jgi:hypothetical protein
MLAKYHIRSCVALPCGAVGVQVHFHAVNFVVVKPRGHILFSFRPGGWSFPAYSRRRAGCAVTIEQRNRGLLPYQRLTSKAHQRAPYGLHAPSVGKRGGPRYPDDARREVIADLKAVAEARREIVRVWRGALHHINC